MAQEPHKRVSQAQVDIWLNDPVTKLYLISIYEKDKATANCIADGKFRDLSNNDLTCNTESDLHGRRYAYGEMSKPQTMLEYMEFIELDKEATDV